LTVVTGPEPGGRLRLHLRPPPNSPARQPGTG